MVADPGGTLDKLFAAFREHMEVALSARDPEDDDVLDAADALGDAFDDYDEALYQATGVDTPLDNLDGYGDDSDEDDDSDDHLDDDDLDEVDLDDDDDEDDDSDEDDDDSEDVLED